MTYKETLSNIMTEMSKDQNTIFIGQQIVYRGNPMSTTLDDVPKDKMIEVPVMEETQMGMSLGLAMTGKKVVTFYPRWDFLISATNQLVNHVDKYNLMTEDNIHMIIRVGKGSDKPLDPGHQHKGNYIEEFKGMLKTVKVFDCKNAKSLKESYEYANNNKGVYIINEYPELYNNYDTFNVICDESNESANKYKMEEIFNETWYDIKDHRFFDLDDIEKKPNENFFHIILISNYLSSKIKIEENIGVPENFKEKIRNNKNFKIIFIMEHECDDYDVIEVVTEQLKKENLPEDQFYIINGNHIIDELKNRNNSKLNVHSSNRLQVVVSRNMVNEAREYSYKKDKKYRFMCYNRMLKSHRFGILCLLKKHNLLDITDWSLLKGYDIKNVIDQNNVMAWWFLGNIFDDEEILQLLDEIGYFSNIDIKKSEYEQDYDVDINQTAFDWDKSFYMNTYSNSYINIVTESKYETKDVVHITDKSLIPFYYSQMPIIVGTQNHIKSMKEKYGLDFFDEFIDHSYDFEEDPKKRLIMIIKELKRLSEIKEDDIRHFYVANKDRFMKNKSIITNITKDMTDHYYLIDLINKK
jgi:hypothetical protein